MPPANTPQLPTPNRSPVLSQEAPNWRLTPPSYLASPGPDLASSLVAPSQAEAEADDENVRFLRAPLEVGTSPPAEAPLQAPAETVAQPAQQSAEHSHVSAQRELRRHQRLVRQLDQFSRATAEPAPVPPPAPSIEPSPSAALRRHERLVRQLDQFRRITASARAESTRERAQPDAATMDMAATTSTAREEPVGEQDQADRDQRNRDGMMRVLSRLSRLENPDAPTEPPWSYSRSDAWESAIATESRRWNEERELEALYQSIRRDHPEMLPTIMSVMSQDRPSLAQSSETNIHQVRQRLHEYIRTHLQQNALDRTRLDADDATQPLLDEPAQSLARERPTDSLRSTAIIQHARTSNSTERMLRYIRDREQTGQGENSQDDAQRRSTSRWSRTASNGLMDNSRYELNRLAWQTSHRSSSDTPRDSILAADRNTTGEDVSQSRLNAYRRNYLAPTTPRPCSIFLENAVKYLDRLRSVSTYDDALVAAIDHGFATKEFFADKHDDFLMDVDTCPSPAPSSWLHPGATFDGSQHTKLVTEAERAATQPLSPPGYDPWRAFDATRPWLSHSSIPPIVYPGSLSTGQAPDNWPVKVTIHAIDKNKMTIAGTMEAYDVPSQPFHSAPTSHSTPSSTSQTPNPTAAAKHKDKPITTYLEGHIIDMRTHSFLTPSTRPSTSTAAPTPHAAAQAAHSSNCYTPYSAPGHHGNEISFPATTPATDAASWRKLPPFSTITDDDEVARILLSRARCAAVGEEYIFMRWKERCFIHSKSDPCRLQQQEPAVSGAGAETTGNRDEHAGRRAAAGATGTGGVGEGDDSDTGHRLTISGFYYISLRRADGRVEGLYFDPLSTPHQCLRLQAAVGAQWGAWAFR